MTTKIEGRADTLPPMPAEEYRAALTRLGLNSRQAGELLGITDVSSRRYATGAQAVPPTLTRLVRLIEAQRLTAEQVRSWLTLP